MCNFLDNDWRGLSEHLKSLREAVKRAKIKEELIGKAFVTHRNEGLVTSWGKNHTDTCTKAYVHLCPDTRAQTLFRFKENETELC